MASFQKSFSHFLSFAQNNFFIPFCGKIIWFELNNKLRKKLPCIHFASLIAACTAILMYFTPKHLQFHFNTHVHTIFNKLNSNPSLITLHVCIYPKFSPICKTFAQNCVEFHLACSLLWEIAFTCRSDVTAATTSSILLFYYYSVMVISLMRYKTCNHLLTILNAQMHAFRVVFSIHGRNAFQSHKKMYPTGITVF